MSILVFQSSWWGRESWLLCLICLPGVSWWLSGSSLRCYRLSAVVFVMSLCASVLCALWSPAGKGLTSWPLFVVSNREFVTF